MKRFCTYHTRDILLDVRRGEEHLTKITAVGFFIGNTDALELQGEKEEKTKVGWRDQDLMMMMVSLSLFASPAVREPQLYSKYHFKVTHVGSKVICFGSEVSKAQDPNSSFWMENLLATLKVQNNPCITHSLSDGSCRFVGCQNASAWTCNRASRFDKLFRKNIFKCITAWLNKRYHGYC
jgi:hypothetical protein